MYKTREFNSTGDQQQARPSENFTYVSGIYSDEISLFPMESARPNQEDIQEQESLRFFRITVIAQCPRR